MENEGHTSLILDKAQRIDRLMRGDAGVRSQPGEAPAALLDLIGCMDRVCDELEGKPQPPASAPPVPPTAEEQLRADQAKLRALASELVLAEERERRQLATDLHDGLDQTLELARIKVALLGLGHRDPDLDRGLKEIAELLEKGLDSARSLTFALSPPILHDLGLLPALQWLAEDLERCTGLHVQVEDDGRPKPLDESISVLLFRSARELLINVAKHARVSRARLEARREGASLALAVQDEGAGFDPLRAASCAGGGFGLFSIRQRLEHLGGRMVVTSAPGSGTTVLLVAPLFESGPGGGPP